MNKILLSNFPHPALRSELHKRERDSVQVHMLHGFEGPADRNEYIPRVRSDVLTSLVIHDQMCLEIAHLSSLLEAFGFEDLITLLKEGCFEIIDDDGLQPMVVGDGINKYKTGTARLLSEGGTRAHDSFGRLEKILLKDIPDHGNEIRALLLQAEAHSVRLENFDRIGNTILNELQYDLKNGNLTESLGIESRDRKDIRVPDIRKVLRLLFVDTSLVYAIENKANCLSIEGGVKAILSQKLSPVLTTFEPHLSADIFKTILSDKRIPDLGLLYSQNLLSINDILEIRNSFHGRKFRDWFYSTEYDISMVREALLARESDLRSRAAKIVRWIVPNTIGLFDPIAGITASLIEGFIVDKIIKGWHPLLFLDDQLKAKIDKNVADHEKTWKEDLNAKWFPNLKEGEECPCGSGKLFGQCCGK